MAFETVTRANFLAAIAESPSSRTFRDVVAKADRGELFDNWPGATYVIHRGPLVLLDQFRAPGYHTLVIGDLIVNGLVDLHYPDADEGGSFVVIGNVSCSIFANDYAKRTIVDGSLSARDLIINAYEDSALWVTKNLKTKFFFGEEIWAEVGGAAEMECGYGYCLPIGYTDATEQAIEPRRDAEASLRLLNTDNVDSITPGELLERAQGRALFK